MKIVSLLPSATEIVCALGLEKHLVGVTHECDYPPSVKALPHVTRTLIPTDATSAEIDALVREHVRAKLALYALDMTVLEHLQPDLIVTQALCDVCAVSEVEVQEAAHCLPGRPRVLNLEPMSLPDVYETLRVVGSATGREEYAAVSVAALQARVAHVVAHTETLSETERPHVAFLEWIDPPFSGGHWNPTLVEAAGGVDVLGRAGQPSRTLLWEEIRRARPDVLFTACCGFDVNRAMRDLPILERQPGWGSLPCVQNGRVYVTDGSAYFNRPGPRLVDSLEILAHALHPEHCPLPAGLRPAHRVGQPSRKASDVSSGGSLPEFLVPNRRLEPF